MVTDSERGIILKYEVINANGQVVMWTESVECIPASESLKAMSDANYQHKVNGIILAYNKVDEVIGRTMSSSSKQIKIKSHKLF